MNLKSLLLALSGALALASASAQNPNPAQAPDTEIVAFEPQPDGLDVFFTGEPNQAYAIYTSSNGRDWEYLTMSASLDGDIFHFYDEEAPNHKARFYRIAVLNQPCQPVGDELERYLLNRIDYRSFLSSGEQDQLTIAVRQYIAAINGTKQAKVGLKQAQTALADYLRLVSAARLAWLEAQKQTGDAKKAKADAEKRLAELRRALEEQKAEREKAKKLRDQMLHEVGVFEKWAKMFEEEGDDRKAAEMRANKAEALERYNFWNDEVGYQDDAVESLENDIADAEQAVTDAETAITDHTTAEGAAKSAYDTANAGKVPLEKGVEDAKGAIEDAEAKQKAAQKAWNDKARDAEEKAREEKRKADAAEYEANNPTPPPAPTAPRPSKRAIAIAQFLEHIREHGGLDAYNDALRSMFGHSLAAGLVTLEGLGAAMKQWAAGKAASGGAVGTALASGVVTFGYGLIAGWVQEAAGAGTQGLANKTIAGLAVIETPNPGDAKFSPGTGRQSRTGELFIRNEDKTVTVFTYRPSQGIVTGNYDIP